MTDKPERLTYRRWRFCQEYIIDYNGTQAAIRAGYAEKSAQEEASRLLSLVIIQENIAILEQDRLDAARITGESVIKDIARLKQKAEDKGELNNAIRAAELLGRNKLWEKNGRGLKASMEKTTDGSITLKFEEGE